MSSDRQTSGAAGATSEMNAVNPGIDEHGDLYARLSRTPKRGAASAMLTTLAGVGVLAGVAVIVMAQGGNRIHAEDVAAPSISQTAH